VALLAVPNFSEGRDPVVIAALRAVLDTDHEVLDRHSDPDHNRTVFTLASDGAALVGLVASAAEVALRRIDMNHHRGLHPCIGALDVSPLVWLTDADRDTALSNARALGARIAELEIPVFLYGELASTEERRERAFFREGGLKGLRGRMAAGRLAPDLGPVAPHPTAGATLVTARPPLAAFNVELETADVGIAQQIAAELREAGGGPPGVRAIGLPLDGRTQVSTNIHDPIGVPLGDVVDRVAVLAARHGTSLRETEIVGLVPQAALAGYPQEIPIRGFDPAHHVLERRFELGA
jgi:glutamate formiminotransferase / 5-formyltetrahydrofolate cyclo-ligase